MQTKRIIEIRDRIGEEYVNMAKEFDNELIADCAARIEMLAQELIEVCEVA